MTSRAITPIIFFVGLGLALWGSGKLARQVQCSFWREAVGSLLSAEVGAGIRTTYVKGRGERTAEYFFPQVSYIYAVGGQTFQGTGYRPPEVDYGEYNVPYPAQRARVEALQKQQKDKGQIAVHYNPANPSQSALDVRLSASPLSLIGLGLGAILMAISSAFPAGPPRALLCALGFCYSSERSWRPTLCDPTYLCGHCWGSTGCV